MMKKMNTLAMVGLTIALCMTTTSGCKPKTTPPAEHQHETTKDDVQKKLDVSFHVNPAKPKAGNETTLHATVKQNNKAITDATVKIEVWKSGDKKHQTLAATHDTDGSYSATSTLAHEGQYNVVVCVHTPSGIHQMTPTTFTVKKPHSCCGHDH